LTYLAMCCIYTAHGLGNPSHLETVMSPIGHRTRAQIARPDIEKALAAENAKVFTRKQLEILLAGNKDFWRLPKSMTVRSFIEFLLAERFLSRAKLKFPGRNVDRYLYLDPSSSEVIASLKADGYFSHYAAVYLHSLTDQLPKTLYLNTEQTPKPRNPAELEQQRIDFAFRRQQRRSKNIASFRNLKVCLLNGKHTGQLGVVDAVGPEGERLRVTSIERTLVDIAVRPEYAGGVHEVLRAYQGARDRAAVTKIVAILRQLDYVYPYHQTIGFYLEKAGGYKKSAVELLRDNDMDFDFYLTYGMKDTEYSRRWRLFFPKGF